MERAPLQMSVAQARDAERAGMVSIQSYARLAVRSLQLGRPLWPMKPKIHKVHHLLRKMGRNRRDLSSFLHTLSNTSPVRLSPRPPVGATTLDRWNNQGYNFRFFHGFLDEDMMGKTAKCASRRASAGRRMCFRRLHT